MAEDELRQQNEEILATGDAVGRRVEAGTAERRSHHVGVDDLHVVGSAGSELHSDVPATFGRHDVGTQEVGEA